MLLGSPSGGWRGWRTMVSVEALMVENVYLCNKIWVVDGGVLGQFRGGGVGCGEGKTRPRWEI